MRLKTLVVASLAILAGSAGPLLAHGGACGDAPPVEESDFKGVLEGKAALLSKYIGDAALKGQVELAKTDVLKQYPKADELRINQYFLYVACLTIMADTKSPMSEKLKELRATREAIFPPKSQLDKFREKYAYIDSLSIEDRILAASMIWVDKQRKEIDNKYPDIIRSLNIVGVFDFNEPLFVRTMQRLQAQGLIQFTTPPGVSNIDFSTRALDEVSFNEWYILTEKGKDLVLKRRLVKF